MLTMCLIRTLRARGIDDQKLKLLEINAASSRAPAATHTARDEKRACGGSHEDPNLP